MKSKKKVAVMPVQTQEEVKNYVVNCPKCGAALQMKTGGVAYLCPVCNTLLRIRKGEKLVKDVSSQLVAETYVSTYED
ncbi:MAG: hypothetical protein J6A38_03495 [Clostridia bacterium]|nr:hypothetical protein [Clostridia bacterium]